jgi:5-formaminoimidazole-4-carboxamide-1-(beta)-D-ribofuranosyl 5'-monophosphate synthetase
VEIFNSGILHGDGEHAANGRGSFPMITKGDIDDVLEAYDQEDVAVATLGSHSALNIFKGAKDEGFRTICVCREKDEITYRRFPLADEMVRVEEFADLLQGNVQERLRNENAILVPHGSFNAYMSMESILSDLRVPMFGNRILLNWEIDRDRQREWLQRAGLRLPKVIDDPARIDRLVISKFPGARGGKGYFLASSQESFNRKAQAYLRKGQLSQEELRRIHFQEYILGVGAYFQYFASPLGDEVEFLGMDRRYESAVDGIGRIPSEEQLNLAVDPTYTIVGNIPITLRESLLPEVLRMGDEVARVSREIAPPGIIGPFCLETVITDDLQIYTFEISARIVAGSNVGIGTSPYAYLKYGEGMYMGRRIAREIRLGIEKDELGRVLY